MNKRERIEAAIAGRPVDRVPYSIWLHNFAEENNEHALARETLRLIEQFDFDLLKPQMRPFCFAQMWGQQFEPSSTAAQLPRITKFAVNNPGDLANLTAVSAAKGALHEQILAMRLIRERVGPDVPIIATVFSPLMNLTLMHARGPDAVFDLQRTHPDELEHALSNMCTTLSEFASMCVDEGLDGLFYATTTANHGQTSKNAFERFQKVFDERILQAAASAPMNVLHICGNAIEAEWFKDYAAPIVSWATTPGNPSLQAMHELTGRCVMGGVPGKPQFGSMPAQALVDHVTRSLQEMNGRSHILGPDCSINPGVDPALIDVVFRTVRSFRLN